MFATRTSEDPLLQLTHSTYYQAVHELDESLPPPAADTDEARAHRIKAAIAQVGSMLPANAEEVSVAVRCVSAHAQSIDSMRQARRFSDDFVRAARCTAQSAAMMRVANSARSLLLRVQAARRKREADPVATDRAAWVEHCAVGLMQGVLHETPHQAADTMPPSTPPPPAPAPVAEATDRFASLTDAEQYAVVYPRRAALIRARGGVPDDCGFGPPEPELVAAILASPSPLLRQLDAPPDRLAA